MNTGIHDMGLHGIMFPYFLLSTNKYKEAISLLQNLSVRLGISRHVQSPNIHASYMAHALQVDARHFFLEDASVSRPD